MKAERFSPDTRAFLRLLQVHRVRRLLVGEIAVIYHGYARLTGDVDFYHDRESDNIDRRWRALTEFWDGSVPGLIDESELADPNIVVQFGRPPNRIDLIGNLPSVPFQTAWNDRVVDSIESPDGPIPMFIVSLEDLIRSKRAAGRPKDLDDILHVDP
ncbi:MAG: hypothetical protein IPM29_26890 [Planctomycetes bacterium]|nr:hypothetical protein [Planctomycetota bacterium]